MMSDQASQITAATVAHGRQGPSRLLGALALAVATAMVAENAVLAATGAPDYGAPIDDVLTYYAANRGAVAITSGLVALYLPLLLVFVAGLQGLAERRHGAGSDAARLAVAAAATLSAGFVLVNALQVGLALSADGLTEPTSTFELVWQVHAAAFGLALPALGATLVGASLATHGAGLTPPWQRIIGLAGGGLLLVAGIGNLAIADGSALIFVGLLGLAAWLGWLIVTGVRLSRLSTNPTQQSRQPSQAALESSME